MEPVDKQVLLKAKAPTSKFEAKQHRKEGLF
jgi:hypothetical protein